MFYFNRRRAFGFTLTEMAIVLAVVGVLAGGLWNIMSGANTQVRDSAAASQQEQLTSAVKSFLSSSQGNAFMENNAGCTTGGSCGPAPGQTQAFQLPLPTSCGPSTFAAPYTADANLPQFCNDLPPGFTSGTTNPYGQGFLIQVLRDTTANPGPAFNTPPASYSFMIMTTGGDIITDTSGARISSLMGNDGGFIYTANVCDTQTGVATTDSSCGAYGGWASSIMTYGFKAAQGVSGTIDSRTYMSPEMIQNNQWLARINLNVLNYTPNTMTVPEYLGDQALVMGNYAAAYPAYTTPNNTLYMGDFNGAVPPNNGGTFDLQGGVINFQYNAPVAATTGTMNVQGGTIYMNSSAAATLGGTIYLDGGAITNNPTATADKSAISLGSSGGANPPALTITTVGSGASNPGVSMASGCNKATPTDATCNWALQITFGDETVNGLLNANSLYANTFIYSSSDRRLKKDIHPIDNTLSNIMRLKPVSFVFKSDDKQGLGFIAQDVEQVYPELVTEGGNGMKAVNYEGLIGPIVSAIQQLQHENQLLRQEVEEQKQHEEELEKELGAKAPN